MTLQGCYPNIIPILTNINPWLPHLLITRLLLQHPKRQRLPLTNLWIHGSWGSDGRRHQANHPDQAPENTRESTSREMHHQYSIFVYDFPNVQRFHCQFQRYVAMFKWPGKAIWNHPGCVLHSVRHFLSSPMRGPKFCWKQYATMVLITVLSRFYWRPKWRTS